MALANNNSSTLLDIKEGMDCYASNATISSGIWNGENPLTYSLPLFLIQLLLVIFLSRLIRFILKPLRQPMIICEIITGMLVGPYGLGKYLKDGYNLFPARSTFIYSTAASFGFMYYAFMAGVGMDLKVLQKMGKKLLLISTASIIVPFVTTTAFTYPFRNMFREAEGNDLYYLYLSIALSVTSFPILARVLCEYRLVSSELGIISMVSSIVNGLLSSALVACIVSVRGLSHGSQLTSASNAYYIPLYTLALILTCLFLVRPVLLCLSRRIPQGKTISDMHAGFILMWVPVAGLVCDWMGIYFFFGAFLYGLAVPTGPQSTLLVERMESIVSSLLMPLMFVSTGIKIDFSLLTHLKTDAVLVLAFSFSCLLKFATTSVVALYCEMPLRESFSLAFLMVSKGFIGANFINLSKNKRILTQESYTLLVIISTLVTSVVVPIFATSYKPSRRIGTKLCRSLMLAGPQSELRVLTCVHSNRNVHPSIAILSLSNPTKRSPIFIYALHLIELTGRASAVLINHNNTTDGKSKKCKYPPSEHIISAFENYEQHTGGIFLQALTSISLYSSMHEDICLVADGKHADIILLPFHKLQTVDGKLETSHPAIRALNRRVLSHAPCSVAILVDRCLGKSSGYYVPYKIAVLFFGGPHDREALAFGWRMADQPSASLAVIRFVPGTKEEIDDDDGDEADRALDEDYLSRFRLKHINTESVEYREIVVDSSEGTVGAIRSMGDVHDLYVVGRVQGSSVSKLVAGMTEWSECPELGPIGDMLASSDFGTTTTSSVLVVQQYVAEEEEAAAQEEEVQPESTSRSMKDYVSKAGHVNVSVVR